MFKTRNDNRQIRNNTKRSKRTLPKTRKTNTTMQSQRTRRKTKHTSKNILQKRRHITNRKPQTKQCNSPSILCKKRRSRKTNNRNRCRTMGNCTITGSINDGPRSNSIHGKSIIQPKTIQKNNHATIRRKRIRITK